MSQASDVDGVIYCQGTRANGTPCKDMLGNNLAGMTVIRHQGRVITGIVFGITCGKCGATYRPRFVREQLPHELTTSLDAA